MAAPGKHRSNATDSETVAKKKRFPGHWSQGLLSSMENPELRVDSDDQAVVIKDKYPKAKYHFLVLPKMKISNLKSVTGDHVSLLKHMHKMGSKIAKRSDENLKFKMGYHSIPSMGQLHLHVISEDFCSPCLKTKKHWNSFTTSYFIDSTEVIETVEKEGKLSVDETLNQKLLKENLRCHVCHKEFTTMPALKQHITQHDYSSK
ncbi:aprataxin [Octopus sinensis]|uniref:Aprataxin n=1 Tax=Octopus sinensis TaxID=2607531 RepID=A0A6P7TG27_9MOLL|nr:aprataxin [Octopus sinensis]